jgi:hypothetical protein
MKRKKTRIHFVSRHLPVIFLLPFVVFRCELLATIIISVFWLVAHTPKCFSFFLFYLWLFAHLEISSHSGLNGKTKPSHTFLKQNCTHKLKIPSRNWKITLRMWMWGGRKVKEVAIFVLLSLSYFWFLHAISRPFTFLHPWPFPLVLVCPIFWLCSIHFSCPASSIGFPLIFLIECFVQF